MRKQCEHCGKFMRTIFHGACINCLRSIKKLPPGLAQLKRDYDVGRVHGREARSVRGIINAVNTLLWDGEWYAVRWDPKSNLVKVLNTLDERPYLNASVIEEIQMIVEDVQ
jgi:hypothetical protein